MEELLTVVLLLWKEWKSKRNVLLCACSKSEAYLVKNAVYQVDDSAFVMFTETSEVLGEGFKESLDEL